MGETCRECRPLYTSSPWHMAIEALEAGAVTKEVSVILCPKHSEVDALRKQLEEARQREQTLIEQLRDWTASAPEYEAVSRLRQEVERLREAIRTRPETYQYVVDADEDSDELGIWHGEEFCFFCGGEMAGQQVNHKPECVWESSKDALGRRG